ncbi:hypothetical protein DERP_011931 [Dermatophagoides pteronyssinus]|uniref:EB domain-containing protein n=1 Tax=Dermatophagoides pteronyssinus TaxID=6956 RepID=A0ABQ8J2Z6_DERPT|nr:hypothetical protein DERP_011931 [Dermatophagoides pteronyssinus]
MIDNNLNLVVYCQQQHEDYNGNFVSSLSLSESSSSLSSSESSSSTKIKYLNRQCDFENIPARGCFLRESYCSLHVCICKPDFPINIADRLCLAKLKSIGDQCEFNDECQLGSICSSNIDSLDIDSDGDGIDHHHQDYRTSKTKKICRCKIGHVYSEKQRKCMKGLKGSSCLNDSDCQTNMFCSLEQCECKNGFEWSTAEDNCLKRSRYGELCDQSINCKFYDEFSECDSQTKHCVCGQFLSHKYLLDEVTGRCISNCPEHRFNHTSQTCLPAKTTVEYSLLDPTSNERKSSLQYGIYIALSMAPFFIFALIGFIYRYINPLYGTLPDTFDHHQHCHHPVVTQQTITENHNDNDDGNGLNSSTLVNNNNNNNSHYCLSIDFDINVNNDNNRPFSFGISPNHTIPSTTIICDSSFEQQHQPSLSIAATIQLPEPPPSYDLSSQDMPPSYDEAVAQQQQQQIPKNY